ncbi:hypothetical protein ACFQL0_12095 [Haloplanus litoreus]|uniref:hypothetical protein n=1 Tax=Haloplanus litoreus TaxID=767515 RepID=UPI0036196622
MIDGDGDIEDLSPTEAREHPVLQDQKLYPFDLTRKRVAATKYRNGIVNTFTSHEDEIEVAPVPGEGNDQPFLVFTDSGPEYIVAVEPRTGTGTQRDLGGRRPNRRVRAVLPDAVPVRGPQGDGLRPTGRTHDRLESISALRTDPRRRRRATVLASPDRPQRQ